MVGLVSAGDGYALAEAYTARDWVVQRLGPILAPPVKSLSCMARLVIPDGKLGVYGLSDGDTPTLLT